MTHRLLIGAVTLLALLMLATLRARAEGEGRYPDWSGQWFRTGGIQFDPTKPLGRGQQAPLTPEYQAKFEAGLADLAAGGHGLDEHVSCLPHGMPRMMNVIYPMEFIVQPNITYMLFEDNLPRRIYTDGRNWPDNVEPSFAGYSIGRWVDQDGNGRFKTLEIETRHMKGPRTFEGSGLPLHEDNQTVIKERIFLDPEKPDVLHDEITTTDHALTRPWTVTKSYRRERNPVWLPVECTEDNHHVTVGKDDFFISADGLLMPAKKDQPPPDLRYFRQSKK